MRHGSALLLGPDPLRQFCRTLTALDIFSHAERAFRSPFPERTRKDRSLPHIIPKTTNRSMGKVAVRRFGTMPGASPYPAVKGEALSPSLSDAVFPPGKARARQTLDMNKN